MDAKLDQPSQSDGPQKPWDQMTLEEKLAWQAAKLRKPSAKKSNEDMEAKLAQKPQDQMTLEE